MKCHPLRWMWGLIPIAVLSLLAALSIKDNVERDLSGRVKEALGQAGLGWAKVAFDGRDGTLSGRAEEETEPGKAIVLGNAVSGVRIFDGQADVLRKVSPYVWAAETAGSKLILTGFVPNQTTHKAVLAAAKSQFPKTEIDDKLDFARGSPPPAEFMDGVKFGLKQLAQLKSGRASLSDTAVSLSGEAPSSAVYKDVKTAFSSGLPKTLKPGDEKVTAPRVDPYTWAAKLAGNQVVLSGYVPGERFRENLIAIAQKAFGKTTVIDKMDLAEGAPDGWDKASKAALDQLATLQDGSAELKGSQLTLSGTAADEAIAEATRKAFKAQVAPSFKTADAIKALKPVAKPFTTRIDASSGAIEVSGYVPSETSRAALISALKSRLPGRTVNDRLQIAGGEPSGYDTCVLSGVAGLARLGNGRASLTDTVIEVGGRTDDEALALALPGEVKAAARGACETKVQIAYEPAKKAPSAAELEAAAQAAAEAKRDVAAAAEADAKRLAAAAAAAAAAAVEEQARKAASVCEGDLRSAAASGVVMFERASDVLARQSQPTLRKLAGIAAKCENVLIEVEGHTDSEGTPERNKNLSERRAQTVADFLTDAGVSAERIKAVGYGETKPVAPNDTAENRAKNRRIEFSVKAK
jgi:OmpA-OmpF porin, OOP family